MRSKFDEQLNKLNDNLVLMGCLCEECITCATSFLITEQESFQNQAIALEKEIDESEDIIRHLCMNILLRQQPVAKDLCLVSAAMKLIVDMERIGDMGKDIAELAPKSFSTKEINGDSKIVKHITKMTEVVCCMVKDAVFSFVSQNKNLAKNVILQDDEVDNLFYKIKADLVKIICEKKDAGSDVLETLMIAKYLERIGDHTVNIAESVEELLG